MAVALAASQPRKDIDFLPKCLHILVHVRVFNLYMYVCVCVCARFCYSFCKTLLSESLKCLEARASTRLDVFTIILLVAIVVDVYLMPVLAAGKQRPSMARALVYDFGYKRALICLYVCIYALTYLYVLYILYSLGRL